MTSTTAPDPTHERPSLEQAPGTPDIRVRLQEWATRVRNLGVLPDLIALLKEARATIKALRLANLRHCEEERIIKKVREILSSEENSSDMLDEIEALIAPAPLPDAPQTGEAGNG